MNIQHPYLFFSTPSQAANLSTEDHWWDSWESTYPNPPIGQLTQPMDVNWQFWQIVKASLLINTHDWTVPLQILALCWVLQVTSMNQWHIVISPYHAKLLSQALTCLSMTEIMNHDWWSNNKTKEFCVPIVMFPLNHLSWCYEPLVVWFEQVEPSLQLSLWEQLTR